MQEAIQQFRQHCRHEIQRLLPSRLSEELGFYAQDRVQRIVEEVLGQAMQGTDRDQAVEAHHAHHLQPPLAGREPTQPTMDPNHNQRPPEMQVNSPQTYFTQTSYTPQSLRQRDRMFEINDDFWTAGPTTDANQLAASVQDPNRTVSNGDMLQGAPPGSVSDQGGPSFELDLLDSGLYSPLTSAHPEYPFGRSPTVRLDLLGVDGATL